MKTHLSILLAWLILSLHSASLFALQQASRINRIEDLLERWTPDQHLYVKGNLGVDDVRYADLEQWLDENAPHWTIVLLQSADNEQYTAANGVRYTGMDAVEHALGYGLANRTGFGQLEHPADRRDGWCGVCLISDRAQVQLLRLGSTGSARLG